MQKLVKIAGYSRPIPQPGMHLIREMRPNLVGTRFDEEGNPVIDYHVGSRCLKLTDTELEQMGNEAHRLKRVLAITGAACSCMSGCEELCISIASQ